MSTEPPIEHVSNVRADALCDTVSVASSLPLAHNSDQRVEVNDQAPLNPRTNAQAHGQLFFGIMIYIVEHLAHTGAQESGCLNNPLALHMIRW